MGQSGAGVFRRDVGAAEHAEILIGERIYRMLSALPNPRWNPENAAPFASTAIPRKIAKLTSKQDGRL